MKHTIRAYTKEELGEYLLEYLGANRAYAKERGNKSPILSHKAEIFEYLYYGSGCLTKFNLSVFREPDNEKAEDFSKQMSILLTLTKLGYLHYRDISGDNRSLANIYSEGDIITVVEKKKSNNA